MFAHEFLKPNSPPDSTINIHSNGSGPFFVHLLVPGSHVKKDGPNISTKTCLEECPAAILKFQTFPSEESFPWGFSTYVRIEAAQNHIEGASTQGLSVNSLTLNLVLFSFQLKVPSETAREKAGSFLGWVSSKILFLRKNQQYIDGDRNLPHSEVCAAMEIITNLRQPLSCPHVCSNWESQH